MKKMLTGYSMAAALFIATLSVPGSLFANATNAAVAELTKLNKPVFQFKTVGKDPYSMLYRSGSNTLEVVTYGYRNEDEKVLHITHAKEQLAHLEPIRMTALYIDNGVKIDQKYLGYRESFLGKALESALMATKVLPQHKYKGTLFVDQYKEALPFHLVFNKVAEISGLCAYLKPLFEQHKLLAQTLIKPLLIIEIDNADKNIAADDLDFLSTYFTIGDPADETIKAFFVAQQDPINRAIDKMSGAKRVKESFFEIIFNNFESASGEFKEKELGAGIAYALLAAVTVDVCKDVIKDFVKDLSCGTQETGGIKKNNYVRNGLRGAVVAAAVALLIADVANQK